jgi:hypothetical protein
LVNKFKIKNTLPKKFELNLQNTDRIIKVLENFGKFLKISLVAIILAGSLNIVTKPPLSSNVEAAKRVVVLKQSKKTSILHLKQLKVQIPKAELVAPVAPSAIISKHSIQGIPQAPTDTRVIRLEKFLRGKYSYLANYAGLIVQLSDQYGVDYRLVVAISGVESGYCKVNFRPNNCWGFGNYSWSSPDQALRGYFAAMNKGYFSKGKRAPASIASPYNPAPQQYLRKLMIHYNQIP